MYYCSIYVRVMMEKSTFNIAIILILCVTIINGQYANVSVHIKKTDNIFAEY